MVLDVFLLDTNILSEARKKKPHPVLADWLRRQARLAIPFPVFVELERGVVNAQAINSPNAMPLRSWLDELLTLDFVYPEVTPACARYLGAMYNCRRSETYGS
ncbi:hypothetical protein [Ensifer sp. B1-9]|uniref:hypothetical protein n=1 Tax=Ensifer sp. B1-9 TaxID=3141455 RepID=UPI003D2099FB